jgi:hypothetical protein
MNAEQKKLPEMPNSQRIQIEELLARSCELLAKNQEPRAKS